jgi:hypothetical protein
MSKRALLVIGLLLSSQVVAAQGAFTKVKSAEEYSSITVITIDEQGKQTAHVFAAKQGVIASDSSLHQAYLAYTAQLAQEGYRQQTQATSARFLELTYAKEQTRGRRRKKQ